LIPLLPKLVARRPLVDAKRQAHRHQPLLKKKKKKKPGFIKEAV